MAQIADNLLKLSAARRLTLALAAALVAASLASTGARASGGCDKVAAPYGSDSGPGTGAAPLRTAQALADSLAPGQTGCLRAGTYLEDLRLNHGGAAGAPLTLESYPGERATITGRLYVPHGSDDVTIANLNLDGTNQHGTNQDQLPSPTVDSAYATFQGDDVTNDNTNICFILGNDSYGRASHTLIEQNHIHNCGAVPSTNHDHGIYIAAADDTQIVGNLIYDNVDRGVQLYPDAQRTTIKGNIIDGNGEGIIFSGAGGVASNSNVVENNVITDSTIRNNVESYYPSGNPVGSGNLVTNNCISGGSYDNGNGGIGDQVGFSASSNIHDNPGFANRGAKDFTLNPGSRCAALLAGAGVGAAATSQPAVTSGTTGLNAAPVQGTPGLHVTAAVKRGRLRVRGTVVSRSAGIRSAGVTRALIELRRHGRWHVVARVTVIAECFSSSVPVGGKRHSFDVRVVVPTIGSVRVRA